MISQLYSHKIPYQPTFSEDAFLGLEFGLKVGGLAPDSDRVGQLAYSLGYHSLGLVSWLQQL